MLPFYHGAQLSLPRQSLCPGVIGSALQTAAWINFSMPFLRLGGSAAAAHQLHYVCVCPICARHLFSWVVAFCYPPPPPPSFPLSPSCFCLTPARTIVRAASNGPPLCAIQRRSFSSMRIFFPQSNTASEGKIHRALIATDNKLFPGDLRSR